MAGDLTDVPGDHPFHVPGTFEASPIFDEPGYPKMHFIEHSYSGDWTNWWAPNRAGSAAMLPSSSSWVSSAAASPADRPQRAASVSAFAGS